MHGSAVAGEWRIEKAGAADAAELMTLQRACWAQEAVANDTLGLPALHESLDDVAAAIAAKHVWVVRVAGRLVGSVQAVADGQTWEIGRLMVAPDLQGRGLGRVLLEHAEAARPSDATAYRLFTGAASEANLRRYKRAGYRVVGSDERYGIPGVELGKPVRRSRR
ncbi:GNAT family N-acetyltransferase [Nocardioides jiangxiensis]|uniref:GNAT family N-acetyltransferase n=1 Tax=Nocardioides jiangxiensis TaxID=3064524 RepID=A0ABT9B7B5_9ACTN|nr:GNAT family N-acetyltransferase [Nocardioides sp. WY-20]MDO7869191.1 GNAT family N-acetyltransferase [Nocardioides sp. WY-20]